MSRLVTLALTCTFAAAVLNSGTLAKDEKGDAKKLPAKQAEGKKVQNPQRIQVQARQIQIARPVFGIFNNPISLLRNPKVQDELKLSDEQKEVAATQLQELIVKLREVRGGLRGLQGEERTKKQKEVEAKVKELVTAAQKKIGLKPQQQTRLSQIRFQQRGLSVFKDAKVIERLKITDEQQQAIGEAQQEGQANFRQLIQDVQAGNVPRNKYAEKRQEISKQTEEDVLAKLTEEQRAEFKKMTGEKFDMPRPRLLAVPIQAQPGGIRIQIRPAQPKQQDKNDKGDT